MGGCRLLYEPEGEPSGPAASPAGIERRYVVDKDRVEGKVKEGVGYAQDKAGEVTGDQEMEARGEQNRAEGKAQGLWGKVKDTAEDVKDAVADKIHR
jgi:uncharacterized protein YjbJ (UPF0337 family)